MPFVAPGVVGKKRMQTNPFCCAVPTDGEPIVLDMATSAIALGKVRVANMKGVPVPEGSLFDAEGVPTTDAGAIASGGALGPFGRHKGYGLALVCELLGGGLAGEWTMADTEKQQEGVTVNHMLMFIVDPDLFGGAAAFRREVMNMGEWLHSSAPAKGFDRVRLRASRSGRRWRSDWRTASRSTISHGIRSWKPRGRLVCPTRKSRGSPTSAACELEGGVA
ncbi:MAG: Ldh family oxidoreductase [Gammaproteobacteria bacterium]|nr:Ldh family oxidoreductase [Gammaproteobacteria bacterium]